MSTAVQTQVSGSAVPAHEASLKTARHTPGQNALVGLLGVLALVWVIPLVFILVNSFKGKFYISDSPFALPTLKTFAGLDNYATGLALSGFASAMGWSLFITVGSVVVIVFLTAMTAYYITRIKTWWTSAIYYAFAFSMIAPFQMVMFPTVKVADMLGLATPWGMIVLYLGFGGGCRCSCSPASSSRSPWRSRRPPTWTAALPCKPISRSLCRCSSPQR